MLEATFSAELKKTLVKEKCDNLLDNDRKGRHWHAALKRQVLAYLGLGWRNRLLEAFDRLYRSGIVPVSRSL
jgi:hypothetical protein